MATALVDAVPVDAVPEDVELSVWVEVCVELVAERDVVRVAGPEAVLELGVL